MAEVRALGLSLLTMGRVRLTERARGASGASNDQVHLGSFRLEVLPSLPVGRTEGPSGGPRVMIRRIHAGGLAARARMGVGPSPLGPRSV